MPPNAFYATLTQSLAQNGSETEVYLSNITTLTGETVTTAQFATLGRGVITVDPLVSSFIEFIAFTAVDATGLGLTGITRGLSALSNLSVTANKKYHPVGAQVIIAFGIHNLLDLQTYITNAVSGSLGTATDATAGSMKSSFSMGSKPRARGAIVSEQASPGMTLKVNPFAWVGNNLNINFAGGNTAAMVAPTVNPRIDLVVYDTNASAVAVRAGTEAVSPSAPTPTSGDIALAQVYHRVGETTILERDIAPNTQGYIQNWYEPTLYTTPTPINNTQVHDATTDQTQGTTNSSITVGEANITTKKSLVAQKFVAGKTSIKGVRLWKIADTGSFAGTIKIALQADSSGSPSGVDLASFTITNAAWLKLIAAAEFEIAFGTEYTALVVGTSYWIVISCSTGDTSNHPNIGINTAGGYASGALKYNNSADGWVLVATSMMYFKTLEGVTSKATNTDATEGIPFSETRPQRIIDIDTTTTAVNATVTETTVYSKQLAGGLFTINAGIRARIILTNDRNGASGGSATVKLKYNGSVLASLSTGTTNSTNGPDILTSIMEMLILNNASQSAQKVFASGMHFTNTMSTAISASTLVNIAPTTSLTTAAIDLSQPGLLEITVTNSVNNINSSYKGAVLEKVAL